MTISVALCAYNGSRFLAEQLRSLERQKRHPDELVVCDDCSTDATWEMLLAFQQNAPFPVRLRRNERNIGSTANFEQAIALCQSDVIALCDQDDFWAPNKLLRIEEEFAADKQLGLVFSDAELTDEALTLLNVRLWECVGYDKKKQRRVLSGDGFEVMRERVVTTGAAMAFRADLRTLLLPIPTDLSLMIHDGWITVLAAAVTTISHIDEPLLMYRSHAGQQVGVRRNPERSLRHANYYREHSRFLDALIRRLEEREDALKGAQTRERIESLKKQMGHVQARATLPKHLRPRIMTILRELAARRYHKYSSGIKSAARDLIPRE